MGRLSADLVPLLNTMVAARKSAKPGSRCGGAELARLAGTTWQVLRRRVDEDKDFPVIVRGEGRLSWTFDTVAALDRLIVTTKALKVQRRRRGAEGARLAGMVGVKPSRPAKADPEPDVPDNAADLAQNARALKAFAEAQMLVHKLKVQQGEYVRADSVTALLADLMTTMQVETLAITTRLDRAGKWPPEVRSARDDDLRTVLMHLQAKVDAVIVNGRVDLD